MIIKIISILVALVTVNLLACSENQEESLKAPIVEVHNGYSATPS